MYAIVILKQEFCCFEQFAPLIPTIICIESLFTYLLAGLDI